MRKPLPIVALALLSLFQFIFSTQSHAQTTRYIKAGASGTGATWANASGDLQAVINASSANDIIWVAGGTYLPNRKANALTIITLNDRDNAFVLKKDVKIYGGFAGTETLLGQRDLTQTSNASILSGDLGTPNDNSDNAYHVVISVNDVGVAELNGFTIKSGNANGVGNITVNLVQVYAFYGGGINNSSSSPILTNITISGNSASAGAGGGICNYSSSSPVLTNVTISGNTADIGSGIYNYFSSPLLTNVTISGNNANTVGGGIYNYNSFPKIRNSIIYGNNSGIDNNISTPVIEYSLVQGSSDVTNGNIDGAATNPLFVNQLAPGLSTGGDYRLKEVSPVINKGNNVYFNVGQTPDLSAITTDLDGNIRIQNGTIDMGAYESLAGPLPITILSFTAKAEGSLAKLEWATATEINNKEFVVSRSADGVDFKELGKVAGAGNSSVKKSYVFYDNHPASGINYYRLQQRDFDGKITNHGIRTVQFSLQNDAVKIYPNPVKNVLLVEFRAGIYQQIELMNNNGKVLQRVSLRAIEKEKTLRMDNYPAGAYLVRFTGKDKEHVEKIVKE